MSQVPLNPEVEDPEAFRKEEQERIDTAEPLTEEETAEKERLLQEVARSICMDFVLLTCLVFRASLIGVGETSTSL